MNTLDEEQKKLLRQMNEDAKILHPDIDLHFIQFVASNYIMNGCKDKDEELNDEDKKRWKDRYTWHMDNNKEKVEIEYEDDKGCAH